METETHALCDLFSQLGLAGDADSIEQFIKSHRPLPESVPITEAPFWSKSQRDLLKQAYILDAEWVPLVDQLNVRLR
ncbi:MAG: DUF2789 domain-containing protein [Pseudomonadota bacterium]